MIVEATDCRFEFVELVLQKLNLEIVQLLFKLATNQLVFVEVVPLLDELVDFNLGLLKLLSQSLDVILNNNLSYFHK